MRRGLAVVVAAVLCAGPLLTACGAPAASAAPEGTLSASATTSAPAAEEPMEGPLRSADLLVTSPREFNAATLAQVQAMPHVVAAQAFTVANIAVQGQLVTLAAVDPQLYRNYTPVESAGADAAWARIAGGELGVAPAVRDLVAPGADGLVTVDLPGAAAKPLETSVGAYLPQVPGIDVVVTEAVGHDLGLGTANALVVSTGVNSPDTVITELSRLLDPDVSIERVDLVAQLGLDPDALQSAVVVGDARQAVGVYTYYATADGQVQPDPAWVSSHIATRTVPLLGSITCNVAMFPQLVAALNDLISQGLGSLIRLSTDCYNPRFTPGTTRLSNHAFGLAIDINPDTNPWHSSNGDMDPRVVATFKKWGFTWGGDWADPDMMHFELHQILAVTG